MWEEVWQRSDKIKRDQETEIRGIRPELEGRQATARRVMQGLQARNICPSPLKADNANGKELSRAARLAGLNRVKSGIGGGMSASFPPTAS